MRRCRAWWFVPVLAVGCAGPSSAAPETRESQSLTVGDVSGWAEVLQKEPDPETVTDAATRERIVASGWPWRVKEKQSGIVLLLVPAGEFTMGSPPTEEKHVPDELPHRRVIRREFYLGECEVSQAQWQRVHDETVRQAIAAENRDAVSGREGNMRLRGGMYFYAEKKDSP